MEFSDFPDLVLHKIFRFLSLNDLVRMSRLNKRFEQISTTIIGETKFLNLSDTDGCLEPGLFEILLELCSKNLEKIHFSNFVYGSYEERVLKIEIFSKMQFPKLIDLRIEIATMTMDQFYHILRNHPDLKRLTIKVSINQFPKPKLSFPPISDFSGEHLEYLDLWAQDADGFPQELSDRFPNLKCFKLRNFEYDSKISNNGHIENFFKTHPKLENLESHLNDIRFRFHNFTNYFDFTNSIFFWQMNFLRSLNLGYSAYGNFGILTKISQHYTNLESLKIKLEGVVDWEIAALGNLKNLKELKLYLFSSDGLDADQEFRHLAMGCSKLHTADLDVICTGSETMKSFIRFCPELKYLGMVHVTDIKTTEKAVEMIQNLEFLPRTPLKIAIYEWKNKRDIWTSEAVMDAASDCKFEDLQVISFTSYARYNSELPRPKYALPGWMHVSDSDDSDYDDEDEENASDDDDGDEDDDDEEKDDENEQEEDDDKFLSME